MKLMPIAVPLSKNGFKKGDFVKYHRNDVKHPYGIATADSGYSSFEAQQFLLLSDREIKEGDGSDAI